jgi:hypothetical protein
MEPVDETSIRALIEAQFAALKWDLGGEADWPEFEAGFLPEAYLVPAARPARPQPVGAFVSRMRNLASQGVLRTFSERPLAISITGFGAIAVALAGCEITENDDTTTRDVSAFLLVRTDGIWRIAAQAWDAETSTNPIPADFIAHSGQRRGSDLCSTFTPEQP